MIEAPPQTRSFFAGAVGKFLETPTQQIIGQLAVRVGLEHAGDEARQIRAWQTQVELLKAAVGSLGDGCRSWGILLELPLLRLGRRVDTILLAGQRIVCIEFKIGADAFGAADIEQTVDYALCLRDFHGGSRDREIFPILCASDAPGSAVPLELLVVDNVAACMLTNAQTLAGALRAVERSTSTAQLDWLAFDTSTYNPTPNIVAAAKALYAGHSVVDIGRADASAEALETTASELRKIIEGVREKSQHAICFVTGEPGSGKTLLGLELVFAGDAGRIAGQPAALLSGNRPLVFVLQEAIALEASERLGLRVKEARRRAQQALQTLLGYLKDHDAAGSPPPENVIVFDEAQRAWDSETGLKLLGRRNSEPELFLQIMGRLPWACLVCLVGPGQEINRGEGGLALWGDALKSLGSKWTTYASEEALKGTRGLPGLVDGIAEGVFPIERAPALHLQSNLRAYRNNRHGQWVEALLAGDLLGAKQIAAEMEHAPAVIARDLEEMRRWLKQRRRGAQRVGLLSSSGAVRLIADGIPSSPRSDELDSVVHWFLKPAGDYRSSNALEVPLSEFVCQGLEIDYAGLCWGGDLIWLNEAWVPRKMVAPTWRHSQSTEARQFRLNTYRVLLTRARAGLAIYVPPGSEEDPTHHREDFDPVFKSLLYAGCEPIAA